MEHVSSVDIIVPVRNGWETTRACLESVRRHTEEGHRIILIDNASTDNTRQATDEGLVDVVIRNEEPRNFAASINQGIAASTAPLVCTLNNDVVVGQGWLRGLLAPMRADARIAAVGPITSNDRDWQGLRYLTHHWRLDLPAAEIPRDALEQWNAFLKMRFRRTHVEIEGMLAFFCTLMRRTALEAVGPLDEAFDFGGEDDDLCYRMVRAGFTLALSLQTYVIHHGGISPGPQPLMTSDRTRRNLARLMEKWPERYRARAS